MTGGAMMPFVQSTVGFGPYWLYWLRIHSSRCITVACWSPPNLS